MGIQPKDIVDTRWVLTRKEADGVKTVKARLVAEGYREPDLRNGNVDIADRVSPRSAHLRLISLVGPEEVAAVQPGNKKFLSPGGWIRSRGLSPCSMHKYLARSVESPPSVRLRFEVSSFGAHLYRMCRKSRGAFGAIAAHIDDILACGKPV